MSAKRSMARAVSFKFEVEVILFGVTHNPNVDGSRRVLSLVSANKRVREHIEESVKQWGGSFYPADVLHPNNVYDVRVNNKQGFLPRVVNIKPQKPRVKTGVKKGTKVRDEHAKGSRKDSI